MRSGEDGGPRGPTRVQILQYMALFYSILTAMRTTEDHRHSLSKKIAGKSQGGGIICSSVGASQSPTPKDFRDLTSQQE